MDREGDDVIPEGLPAFDPGMLAEATRLRDELLQALRERRRSFWALMALGAACALANLACAAHGVVRLHADPGDVFRWALLAANAWACHHITMHCLRVTHMWRFERAHLAQMIMELQVRLDALALVRDLNREIAR